MKRSFLVLLLLAAFGLSQCSEDHDPAQGQVVFSFDSPPLANGKKSSSIPDGSSIIITISKNGQRLLDFDSIELLKFGDHFVSKPLRLPEGKYSIDDFLVAKEGEILFATPKKGSKLSNLINNSLPYTFNVSHSHVNTISMEVIDVSFEDPEALGYASFRMKVVHPFKVSVFVYEKGKLKLTHADLQLVHQGSVVSNFRLLPKINTVGFTGDHSITYQLVISKEGYRDEIVDFNYKGHFLENGNKPLEVILDPIPEASFTAVSDVLLYLTFVKSGSITVDWPDGSVDEVEFKATPTDPDKLSFAQLSHTLNDSSGIVALSGDLEQVVEFVSAASLSSIDISNLINLQSLTLENSVIDRIDLRNNKSLVTLAFVNTSIHDIFLPHEHSISNVHIEGMEGQPSTLPVNEVIHSIYENAIANNITDGAFILFHAGEVDPSSLDQLNELQASLGWYVEIE